MAFAAGDTILTSTPNPDHRVLLCRKDAGVVDEIPAAYKYIDEVIRKQSDLVEIVAKLKQVICVKG